MSVFVNQTKPAFGCVPSLKTLRTTGNFPRSILALWCLFLVVLLLIALPAGAAHADANSPPPPPERDTQSGTGVSLVSGAYTYSAKELKIGAGDFPQALVFDLTYSSGLDPKLGRYDGILGVGWGTSLVAYLSGSPNPVEGVPYPPNSEPVQYSVIAGESSLGSFIENEGTDSGNFEGPWTTFSLRQGQSLEFLRNQTDFNQSEILFTDKDGTKTYFYPDYPSTERKRLEARDGTILTFNYDGLVLKSVTSNRGIAILFEITDGKWTKACTVNLAEHYITTTSNCPAGVPSVTFSHEDIPVGAPNLLSITDAVGGTTSFEYTSEDQLNCIKLPGQSACQVTNTYSNCVRAPSEPADPPGMNTHQQVMSQSFIDGETVTYSFPSEIRCPPAPSGSAVTMTFEDSSTKFVQTERSGLPTLIRDQNGHETIYENEYVDWNGANTLLKDVQYPEGNRTEFGYDLNGNTTAVTQVSKDGQSQHTWQMTYGACNQVTSQIDPIGSSLSDPTGHVTNYEYDPVHCGVTRVTRPADANGVRPQTRYSYAQRYAWVKNSSGGYSQAASPVWVLASEEFCRTSAADVNGNCAAGTSDKVVTTYDYGPDAGPNNLWLRGKAITAEGTTLRTCYGNDSYGRRISETAPAANLSSCP